MWGKTTPEELRERARSAGELAEAMSDAKLRQLYAERAFALAQEAEALELCLRTRRRVDELVRSCRENQNRLHTAAMSFSEMHALLRISIDRAKALIQSGTYGILSGKCAETAPEPLQNPEPLAHPSVELAASPALHARSVRRTSPRARKAGASDGRTQY